MAFKRIFLTTLFAGAWVTGCAQNTAVHVFDPTNKVLMISCPDSKLPETYSSEKSELVLFDLKEKKSLRLTTDLYKDDHPTWSPDGRKILFESKRPDAAMLAENGPSHLYLLNIATGQIERFDKDFRKKYPNQIGSENSSPAWSKKSNTIAFVTRLSSDSAYIMVLDLNNGTLRRLSYVGYGAQIRWSADATTIAYQSLYFGGDLKDGTMTQELVIMNVKTGLKDIIPNNEELNYDFIAWYDSSSVLLSRWNSKFKKSDFLIYHSKTKSFSPLSQLPSAQLRPVEIGTTEEEMLLMNVKSDSVYTQDLWLFNASKHSLDRLTSDGKLKAHIQYFRP
jgi:Tol biopolymer transport system component